MQFSIAFVLFVLFLALKLCGVIAWSWWWVTAPIWGAFALTVLLLVLFGAGALTLLRVVNKQRR